MAIRLTGYSLYGKEPVMMNDTQIIELLWNRDETALSELGNRYGRLCSQLSFNILNNHSDAEECVNDAWLGVWNSIPPNRPESLIGYVCRLVRNISLKRYSYNTAQKRNSCYDVALEELEGVLVDTKDVESEVEGAHLTETIEHFLDSLKQMDRVIFIRRYYFAASYAEIAAQCGISEKNVSVKLTRLREKLKAYLKEQGYSL